MEAKSYYFYRSACNLDCRFDSFGKNGYRISEPIPVGRITYYMFEDIRFMTKNICMAATEFNYHDCIEEIIRILKKNDSQL